MHINVHDVYNYMRKVLLYNKYMVKFENMPGK